MQVSSRVYMATVASSIIAMGAAMLFGNIASLALALVVYVASVLVLTPVSR